MSLIVENTNSNGKLVVLGLDGLPLSLARKLAATGRFPSLARLTPSATEMQAELPELSPVNWTSFYTAADPGEHGVYGFTRIHSRDYTMGLCNFEQPQHPTIFDRLGEAGYRTRSINLPNTYPARAINGMLISGFVAEELSQAVYPKFLLNMLGADFLLEADTTTGASDPAFLLDQLRKTLAARKRAFSLLWKDGAWDLFIFVLTETDRLFHFLFDAVEEPAHPWHAECLSLLEEWDSLIGEVLDAYDALPEPKRLMSLADHGFTRLITEVDLNALLRDMGLLATQLPPEACNELDPQQISARCKAFALDPGRIYIHATSRFARGTIADSDIPALEQSIAEQLMAVTYNGQRVFKQIHKGQKLYTGKMAQFAPNLVCEPVAGFDLKAKFNRREPFGFFGRTGTHTVQDTFFYDSHNAQPQRVRDVGTEILRHFDLER
ncbi:alkaline phosphatase family protein [Halodesulfovibrio spirochaetisodalis]|uniref:Phosphodiesterase n=1 Tax=Halodesulfovibrio spirochaetisodalis TaxID=1560234 RepID=A0A1B7XD48_9BACT|nr:alkaline phosphatase family protein [Halodesulfovibrio spirochaetisodalis]OBQ51887.1 phosphodiesterase [Halodesulfovibrio spirochaetisodalis]